MRIGLVDIDSHAKVKKWGVTIYPNLALCKIAAYHRAQGDEVEWAIPLCHYDIIYKSKIFNFSPDDLTAYDADKIVRGGTGYDIESKLPNEIDRTHPDYSIYPSVPTDIAYGFLTRGCPNKCKWCVVPRKEGAIAPYMDIDEVADGRKKVVLMDNNILAAGDYAIEQLTKIIEKGYRVDFNQALDARLVTDEFARLLAKIKWLGNDRIRFGCDTHKQIEDCERAIDLINGYGFNGQYFLYTMLGSDFQECLTRTAYWQERLQEYRRTKQGRPIYIHAQPFRDPYRKNSPPQWQKDMARWANCKQIFTQTPFIEYQPRKNFICKSYLNQLL